MQLAQGGRVDAALRSVGFEPTEIDVAPSATVRIDLERSPEELLEGMSKRRDATETELP